MLFIRAACCSCGSSFAMAIRIMLFISPVFCRCLHDTAPRPVARRSIFVLARGGVLGGMRKQSAVRPVF